MSDATQKCPVCGAVLPARAKFCAECGTTLKTSAAAAPVTAAPVAMTTNQILPWFIAGVCVLAVFAMVIIIAVRRPEPAPGNQSNAPFAQGGSPATGTAPDISNMTPREAADRLYDRIARASESGDSGQVSFFAPMALQAYAAVRPLDIDARLHIGMIELAAGNPAGASAQADSIQRESRTHLFGPLLKARVAEAQNNAALRRQAYQQFLANWSAERAKNLPEYAQHETVLNEVHTAAQNGTR
jgi:hypothetical protein